MSVYPVREFPPFGPGSSYRRAVNVQVRDQLNARLHAALGADEACKHGCPHRVVGRWTALGIANVVGRIDAEDIDLEIMRGRVIWRSSGNASSTNTSPS